MPRAGSRPPATPLNTRQPTEKRDDQECRDHGRVDLADAGFGQNDIATVETAMVKRETADFNGFLMIECCLQILAFLLEWRISDQGASSAFDVPFLENTSFLGFRQIGARYILFVHKQIGEHRAMAANIAGIDHAIIGVRDLDKAKATFEKLGFRATPRGRHVGWGTANYCLMFELDYLEILGIVDPEAFTNDLDQFLETREGLMSLALRTTDPEATRSAWAEATLDPAEVKDLSRHLEPDTELRFKNVMLEPKKTADVPVFACAHLTPEPMRQPGWTEHPNGAIGINAITVVTLEPKSFIDPMSRIFGETKLTETDNTLAVHTGRGVLMFATPDDLDMLHPQLRADLADEKARLAVLSLRVRSLAAVADWLDHKGILYKREASGAIGVGAEHAHGVMLEFTE